MHRNVQNGHTQKRNAAEFRIFTLKVRYSRSKVKPLMDHLTHLMTALDHHIYLVGRPRQGQYAIRMSRSPDQGHRGQKKFKVKKICLLKNARNCLKCIENRKKFFEFFPY